MAVEKTKHTFVDDNPYLVYSGEPDTCVNNAGGGGGGDDNIFIVEMYADQGQPKTDVLFDDIFNAVQAGKLVFLAGDPGTYGNEWVNVPMASCSRSRILFSSIKYITESDIAFVEYRISSDNTFSRVIKNVPLNT